MKSQIQKIIFVFMAGLLISSVTLAGDLTVVDVRVNDLFQNPQDLPSGPQPTSWQTQRSMVATVTVQFSGPIEMVKTDFHMWNTDQSELYPVAAFWEISEDLTTYTLYFGHDPNTLIDSTLTDGPYKMYVYHPDLQFGFFQYTATPENRFHVLRNDMNGDGGVSIFDIAGLGYWFGNATPPAPGYLDANEDGGISILDFPNNFGESINY